MKLSILTPTLDTRRDYLARLRECLTPQLNNAPEVEWLIDCDRGDRSTGIKRNALLLRAKGEYSVMIDDDDLVADDYVARVLEATTSKADAIGYFLVRYVDGKRDGLALHSGRNNAYQNITHNGEPYYQRTINHVCPIRTELARRVGYPDLTIGEDNIFAERIAPLINSEVFISQEMYWYYFRSHKHNGNKILIKYPTRQRKELFYRRFENWNSRAKYGERLHWLVSLDNNDNSMSGMGSWLSSKQVEYYYGESANKVDAINRDIDKTQFDWDILVVCSDDFEVEANWDERIDQEFPGKDWGLWFADGRQKRICTLPIIGREAFRNLLGG